jgi:hypothetical protein
VNRSTQKGEASESKTKLEYFGAESLIAKTPDLEQLDYLAFHWRDVGMVSSNGFGSDAIDPSSLESYCRIHGLAAWESQLIYAMSRAFIDAKRMFDEKLCECPYRYKDKPMLELQLLASRPMVKIE